MAQAIAFEAVVEDFARHDADVVTLTMKACRRLPRFAPGQFIHLTLEPYDPAGFWPESRVFSIANAVTDRQTITLTISRQGDYTSRILDTLAPGSRIWCKGPYGDFRIRPLGASAVLIAGGTGITPFAAFMDSALAAGELPVPHVHLYYGARSTRLLIYRPLALRCANELEGFDVHLFAEETSSDECISTGRLDIAAIARETSSLADPRYYISGPETMIRSFQACLQNDDGIPADHVLIDAW